MLAVVPIKGFNPIAGVYIARETGRPDTPNRRAFWEFAFGEATEDIRNREGTIPWPEES